MTKGIDKMCFLQQIDKKVHMAYICTNKQCSDETAQLDALQTTGIVLIFIPNFLSYLSSCLDVIRGAEIAKPDIPRPDKVAPDVPTVNLPEKLRKCNKLMLFS